jgi:putative ABC transport system substrate-binding protein
MAALCLEHRLPALTLFDELARAGVMMAYGWRLSDLVRRVPWYVDRILKGAAPAELPVEQPTRFYLTLNLKTARALGLQLPAALLLSAEEVIQ